MKGAKCAESEKSFSRLLQEGLVTSFTWNLAAVVVITAVIYLLRGPSTVDSFIGSKLSFTQFVITIILVLFVNAIVGAMYIYARVRNPRYIAKQEAYERMQAERAAKLASADKSCNGKTL